METRGYHANDKESVCVREIKRFVSSMGEMLPVCDYNAYFCHAWLPQTTNLTVSSSKCSLRSVSEP